MRKAIAFALFVAACASVSHEPPFARLRGCWIDREQMAAATMRWFPDAAREGVWTGEMLYYPNPVAAEGPHRAEYTLERKEGRWMFCGLPPAFPGEAQTACQPVGSVVTIAADAERLTITDTRDDRVVFEGQRDGCD